MPTDPAVVPGEGRSVLDRVIRASIAQRGLVMFLALAVVAWGAVVARRMPVDAFPDVTAPTVSVVTEAHGLDPEQVEVQVTAPIEAAVAGQPGVRRVRSVSGIGISIVWVEFGWAAGPARARQLVAEALQVAADRLPPGLPSPRMAPESSVMGEIMFVGLRGDGLPAHDVRDVAERVVRRRLLAIPGVAQVVPTGGSERQYQVLADPVRLRRHGLTLAHLSAAIGAAGQDAAAGVLVQGDQQLIVRGLGRLRSLDDVAAVVVAAPGGVPVTVAQLADVRIGGGVEIGAGAVRGAPAVVMAIGKQAGANTLALTAAIERELDAIAATLPAGIVLERDLFQQAEFIGHAVGNVKLALRDGAVLVVLVILLFLVDLRATLISALSLPVSLLAALIVLDALGTGLDTMVLGGLTIAIGALVDDAIIDVENVVRRLRQAAADPPGQRRSPQQVIYEASVEIRGSIVYATAIVVLVFVPVFFLHGVEGRLLAPLGLAYVVALAASLVVALTVTPALCALLLPALAARPHRERGLTRWLGAAYARVLAGALRRGGAVVALAVALAVGAGAATPLLGRTFLPPFNEGALTVNVVMPAGTSLAASDARGRRVEQVLLGFPEVVATTRRTGRAELDEHAQDASASEIEVRLRQTSRPRGEFLAELRAAFAALPGTNVVIGQPISHRIDHLLSGTRAAIAIKIAGDELAVLRRLAEQVQQVAASVPGAVDVSVEQPGDYPQLAVAFDAGRAAQVGARPGELAAAMEHALVGEKVAQVFEQQRAFDVVVRYGGAVRDADDLRQVPLDVPLGAPRPVGTLADVRRDVGPATIAREGGQRKLVVMANVAGRDLGSVVDELRRRVAAEVTLPEGYGISYGGQFESQQRASERLLLLGVAAVLGIVVLLQVAFGSWALALVVMANLPLALIGGVTAVLVTDRVVSVGSLIGFVTLFGIATRNGIMLIAHYEHLRAAGVALDEAIRRGSVERMTPVLMTALCAGLALVPMVLAGSEPGNEIQAPMSVVILGGLATSTVLNLVVVPILYRWLRTPRRGTAVAPPPAHDAGGTA